MSCQVIKTPTGGAGGKAPAGGLGVSPSYYFPPLLQERGPGGEVYAHENEVLYMYHDLADATLV
ncbi:hypothetical protein ACFLX5_03005 [Chloroflexota bacterium]